MIIKPGNAIILFLLLFSFSCTKKDKLPVYPEGFRVDSLISGDKMALIMMDVHLIEASLVMDRNKGIISKDRNSFLYQGIFSKYHISRARYNDNLSYYSMNPEIYAVIYGKVIKFLEDKQNQKFSKKGSKLRVNRSNLGKVGTVK